MLPCNTICKKMVGAKWTNEEMINLDTKESEQHCLVISCTLVLLSSLVALVPNSFHLKTSSVPFLVIVDFS